MSRVIAGIFCLFYTCLPNLCRTQEVPIQKIQWPYAHPYLKTPDSLYSQNQFAEAFTYYHRALVLFTQEKNLEGILKCKNMIAIEFQLDNDLDSAIFTLTEIILMAEENNLRGHPEVAKAHYLLGQTYDFKGELELALTEHRKALGLKEELFGSRHIEIAKSLNGIGEVYLFTKNDFHNAERYLYLSLGLFEDLRITSGKDLARTYYNLASANRFNEDYKKALAYANKALQTYSDLPQQNQRYIGNCYSLLANIYYETRNYDRAIELNLRAIQYFMGTSKINAHDSLNMANFFKNLGAVYTDLEHSDTANHYYQLALNVYSRQTRPLDISYCFLNMGRNFIRQGITDSAEIYLQKALKIRENLFDTKHSSVSDAYRFLGDFQLSRYHKSNEIDYLNHSLYYYQRALIAAHPKFKEQDVKINPVSEGLVADRALFLALSRKGNTLQAKYRATKLIEDLRLSYECYSLALDILDLNRMSFEQEGSKLFQSELYSLTFENALECVWLLYERTDDLNYIKQAFELMEDSKSKLVLEAFNKLQVINNVGVPDSLIHLERSLKADNAYLSRKLTDNLDSLKLRQLQNKIFQNARNLELIKGTLQKYFPSYYQLKYESDLTYDELISVINSNQSQIIEYFWGDSSIYITALGDVVSFKKVKLDEINGSIVEYYRLLENGPRFENERSQCDSYKYYAYRIYTELISKFVTPTATSKLVIIPDGLLRQIPFESLITLMDSSARFKDLPYLMKDFELTYAYSANLWARNYQIKPKSKYSLLGIAYSAEIEPIEQRERAISNIPGTYQEIKAISKYMNTVELVGNSATEANFKQEAPGYDIIHLAVHGIADTSVHYNNRLLFNQGDISEDGILYVYELYNLKMNPKLVVLSSCESGIGENYKGEGIYSIARGFAYAGCPNMVLALWKVNDKTAPTIMEEFYRQISKGKSIDRALQQAKINYVKTTSETAAHPANWAPFVLIGNYETTLDDKSSLKYYLLAIVIMVLVSVFIYYQKWRGFKKIKKPHHHI